MISLRLLAGVTLLAIVSTPPTVGAQNIDKYRPVTQERLIKPEPENWLMYRGSYDGFGYSALDKINTRNVKNLVPVWSFSTGMLEGHQSPPIVNDGIMFVTTPNGQVLAFNASNGELLWRYARELPEDLVQAHPTNRGVALFEDKVYVATVDAHVVALDARTGKVVWDTAAGVLLVREAGGFVTDYRGADRAFERSEYLAASSTIHSKLQKLVAGALR